MITRGMVSSNSLPDSPRRRGGLARGIISVVGWSSVPDTLSAFAGPVLEDAIHRPARSNYGSLMSVVSSFRLRSIELPSSPLKTPQKSDYSRQIRRFEENRPNILQSLTKTGRSLLSRANCQG